MKAQMEMRMDTTFGNTAVLLITAELDNPHERTNNVLLRDMAKMLEHGATQIRHQSEQALAKSERAKSEQEPADSQATRSMAADWEEQA